MDNKIKTVYISGPMRGKENRNREAFGRAVSRLQHMGVYQKIISPLDLNISDETSSQRECARQDIKDILDSDAIYMLSGWETSIGARAEHAVAVWIGLDIIYED